MFKNLLFDFDGTLVQSDAAIFDGLIRTYEILGLEVPSEEVLKKFIGPSLVEGFTKYGGITEGEQLNEAMKIYCDLFDNHTYSKCQTYTSLIDTIKKIRSITNDNGERKYKLLVTSARKITSLQQLMEMLDISKYFDGIYGSNEETISNVKKIVIEKAFKEQNIKSRLETLLIGDRFYDIDGGHDFGIKVCAVLWGYGSIEEFKEHKADFIINEPNELFNIIK